MTQPSPPRSALPSPILIVCAAAMSLALAMGIGRFAFTAILPVMIAQNALDLKLGSTLASANYLGYLVGALGCMTIPSRQSSARILRLGLLATVLASLAMIIPSPTLWIALRFAAGVISAVTMVQTARWCFLSLAHLQHAKLGSAMFTGVGLGIGISGLICMAMIAADLDWQSLWVSFALIGCLMAGFVWSVATPAREALCTPASARAQPAAQATAPRPQASRARLALFVLAYGLAGFGYIITATYLPLIARIELPGSALVDFFWPLFGFAAALGSFLATRLHDRLPPQNILILCYLMQSAGVMWTTFRPDATGLAVGALLAGLPFTAINFFAMDVAQRLYPNRVSQLIGLLTAAYAIGQILGPATVQLVLHHVSDLQSGFNLSLHIAGGALLAGALGFVALGVLRRVYGPVNATLTRN
ncbi:YbfB/YjiJ family MFS transporter [Thioclava kandeliae]|uniref:YbfB/YjiJ family MFS transporter n=1 Tax=Thioclava kandeliae TaxID=3070818 RepID=A0ABV1SHH6_9RHOB